MLPCRRVNRIITSLVPLAGQLLLDHVLEGHLERGQDLLHVSFYLHLSNGLCVTRILVRGTVEIF